MRKYLVSAAILAGGVALGGCASMAEIRAANMARDDETCRAMGFRPVADDYKLCRLTAFQVREDRNVRIDAERTAAGWRYLQDIGGLGSASNPLNVRVTGY